MDFSILFDFAATAADPEMFAYVTSYEMFKLHWVGPGNTSLWSAVFFNWIQDLE